MLESTVDTVLVICTTDFSVFLNIVVRFSCVTGTEIVVEKLVEYTLFVDIWVTTTIASTAIMEISMTCLGFVANT
ncbi:protein of unknown function [Candidatus Nitrosotalea okcheonensis]|uniref:Uncharacterized protein n=1 Tax=Candidatus Nitrosotalea okcheonensis TaxID=1903276 RepID=A0A2H1FI53_9ARCH|nr:protein of unknown function [Candidatus Nitrosotalea okcheonensis]